ncbi:MAG: type IV pilin protein [Azoarcus sp.]|jgi:type IV pilus assembly protein PilE|nr:type IV pilin protein [Azoarcus sp.]
MLAHSQKGFTLIELMIAIVIVALLVGIALPSYREQVRRTKRAECEAVLLKAASMLERHHSANYVYAFTTEVESTLQCPPGGGDATYTFKKEILDTGGFKLNAIPAGGQTGDRCGTLTLDHTGSKGSALTSAECWR